MHPNKGARAERLRKDNSLPEMEGMPGWKKDILKVRLAKDPGTIGFRRIIAGMMDGKSWELSDAVKC